VQGKPESISLLSLLPEKGFAIVGTRHPQARNVNFVCEIISHLRNSGLIILSGMARGIDSAAHIAAMDAGLQTIAVVAGGVDVPYPPENAVLQKRILENGGLVISEYPPGTKPEAWNFLRRNRLIANWSKATWVAEAAFRSGALNTAKWARDYHRTSFATPCFPGDRALAGNQGLIDEHEAQPLWSVKSLGGVWSELNTFPKKRRKKKDLPLLDPIMAETDTGKLVSEVRTLQSVQAGARVETLLDWALRQGWSPQRFFEAIQASLHSGLVKDVSGQLVSS
jgi:DNA protecting protein DprA